MKRERNGRRRQNDRNAPRAEVDARAGALERWRGKRNAAVRVGNLGRNPWRLRGPPRMGGLNRADTRPVAGSRQAGNSLRSRLTRFRIS